MSDKVFVVTTGTTRHVITGGSVSSAAAEAAAAAALASKNAAGISETNAAGSAAAANTSKNAAAGSSTAAAGSAGAAAGSQSAAAGSAAAALTSENAAAAYKVSAADSAAMAALYVGLFASTALGLAGTTSGQYFGVPSASDSEYSTLYQNSGGTAVKIKVHANVGELLEVIVPGETTPVLGMWTGKGLDGVSYELLAFLADGTLRSVPMERFVAGRLGGATFELAEASGWGPVVIAQKDGSGNLWAVSGMTSDNKTYAPGLDLTSAGELIHIAFEGQSNAVADEALPSITTADTKWGNKRLSMGIFTWNAASNASTPALRPDAGFAFVPLVAQTNETRANGLADAYKARLIDASRYSAKDTSGSPYILPTTASTGSRGIVEIGPENDGDTSSDPGRASPGGHWPTMLDNVARIKAKAESLGMKYTMPFWFYDQGERESTGLIYRYLPAYALSVARGMYKTKAATMAETMDSAVRALTGQTRPIPLFVTPACGPIITASAWVEVANEHPLVFYATPRYMTLSAVNSSSGTGALQRWGNFLHHTADSHRWVGEMGAKVAYRVMHQGEDWKPLQPISAVKVDSTHVDVMFNVPRPPLVMDTSWLPKMRGWGFSLFTGTIDAPAGEQFATDYEMRPGGNVIRFTFASVPSGAQMKFGNTQQAELGINPAITAIAAGAATAHGFTTTNYSFAGDIRAALAPLSQEGAFYITSQARQASSTIRSVTYNSGTNTTIMNAEDREVRSDGSYVPMQVGDTIYFSRIISALNLRDSDPASSLYTFVEGSRAGQLYPLWNWCVQYDSLLIK